MMDEKPTLPRTYYRANLPHIQPVGATFFVTFRLKDSMPAQVVKELREEYERTIKPFENKPVQEREMLIRNERKRSFARFDDWLHKTTKGAHYLRQPEIAQVVKDQLHRFDGELYKLIAYTIISNHVHVLFDTSIQLNEVEDWDFPWQYKPLEIIMERVKGASARYANLSLGRTGNKFWQRESFDHYVRNEREFYNIIAYILKDPVKAGIVANWFEFPHNFVAAGFSPPLE
jgi:REP element-mobilizing transposase RayT